VALPEISGGAALSASLILSSRGKEKVISRLWSACLGVDDEARSEKEKTC
jgi:hypothetical protein